ncbi:MAG: hypothetical protein ABW069_02025 [Duganella sp.]
MPIYVQHEVLGRIADVFNAEAIWQAPGLALFSRRPLLRDLLERSPREHRGRAATRCFSHVTLVLPQEDVDDDYHLTRGARARDLAQTLASLHQKDFGDLLGSDQVRYDVVGAETLAPGEIAVRFGHAVYLPAPDEKILYNVSVSRDSAIWHPVCPIYPSQRLALIGGQGGAGHVGPAGWPFGPDGAILIINDGPDAVPVVEMRPRGDFDCRFDPRSGYYTIKSLRNEAGGSARLLLKIARSGRAVPAVQAPVAPMVPTMPMMPTMPTMPMVPVALPAHPTTRVMPAADAGAGATASTPRPAVWQSRADGMPLDLTAIPVSHKPVNLPGESDATYAPLAQQRVQLVALALPRLSRYRDTGAQALELPFDQTLSLSPAALDAPAISFVIDAADNLYACTAEGRQRITAPATFTPVDARTMRLLPTAPQMADRYHAMLCLAQPVGAAVASGARFTFGRSSPMLAALRLLDSPRFIRRADGDAAPSTASADRIGLSRNAFSFEASDQGYRIGRLSATQALYHLDERMAYVGAIAATGDANADAPYLLPHGHHLVAGHYVLRFDA